MKPMKIDGFAQPTSPGNAPGANGTPAFKIDIPRSLRMRPYLAAGVAVVVLVIILGYVFTRKPMYESESQVYVEPLSAKILSDGSSGAFDPTRYESYMGQQILTAQRPDILTAAVASLPAGVWKFPGESNEGAAGRLAGVLHVQRVPSSYQLSIGATGRDPKSVAAVVNAVTTTYLAQGSKDEHTNADVKLQLLSDEKQRIQGELEQARAEQTSLGASLGVANPVGETANAYDVQLAGIRTELTTAREAHAQAEAQLASMNTKSGGQAPALAAAADDAIAGDAGLSSMKATINQRRAQLQSQMAGLTPSNPVYKQDQDEIATVDRDVATMTAQLQTRAEQKLDDKLRHDLNRTGDVESRLNAQLAHETALATGAAPKLQRAAEVEADIQRLQTRFAAVDDAIRGLELESSGPGLAHLSLAAAVPTAPESSRAQLLLMLALPLALFAGIAAAVLAQKRDPHVYIGRDVEDSLGFLPIGVMPAAHQVSDGVLEEYLLRLAAGLERAYRVSEARSFVFTAVSPSTETGTFVHAVQRKLVDLGFTALVIQAEALLGSEDSRVDHRANRGQVLQGEIVTLDAAHAGFAAAKLDRLKQDHDLLLIDARPLLHSAQSEYAVRSTDATLLLAESGVTTGQELKQAGVLLNRLHVPGVGVVLQEMRLEFGDPAFRSAVSALESMPVRTKVRAVAVETPLTASPSLETVAEIEEPARAVVEVPEEVATVQPFVVESYEVPLEVAAPPLEVAAPTAANMEKPLVSSMESEPEVVAALEVSAEPLFAAQPVVEEVVESPAEEVIATFEPSFSLSEHFFSGFHEPMMSMFPEEEEVTGAVEPVFAEAATFVEEAPMVAPEVVEAPVMPVEESPIAAHAAAVVDQAPVVAFVESPLALEPQDAKADRAASPHLSMRHFEFRQGRIRRETAAISPAATGSRSQIPVAVRRESGSIALSELHRPSPVQELLAKSAAASVRTSQGALYFEEKPQSRNARAPHSWAALNRFERRFEVSHSVVESEEEAALVAFGRAANDHARQA